jgi:hypothetical protein
LVENAQRRGRQYFGLLFVVPLVAVNMVVERIDSMAAVSSAVLPAAIHRRGGCSLTGQNSRGYQSDQPLEQDLVRLHSGGCESKQAGQEFLSVKDSTRRRKVSYYTEDASGFCVHCFISAQDLKRLLASGENFCMASSIMMRESSLLA